MSASVGSGDPNSQDVDLNLAPIIDAFVVLISFLLVSASMLAIGILDAGISAPGKAAKSATPPPIQVAVDLKKNQRIQIAVTGKARKNLWLNANKDGSWNFEALQTQLQGMKTKWPKLSAVTLKADNKIPYKDVVQAMQILRKVLPAVLLGGF